MTPTARGFCLTLVVLASTLTVAPRARAASGPSPAAYVYIQITGPHGAVYGLRASASGQLSPISGSPFRLAGQIVGSTPTKFFTLGRDLIHSYRVGSNGALQSQLFQMPVFDYAGSRCGGGTSGQNGAVLDHSGKYIYVMLDDGFHDSVDCAAYQSYIVHSDGSFAFDGDTEITSPLYTGAPSGFGVPSILGNESFAYSEYQYGGNSEVLTGFRRDSSGTLNFMPDFHWSAPPVTGGYTGYSPDASPTGRYVVLSVYPENTNPPQFGSFTVDSQGNLSTTNTSSNMPTSALVEPSTIFSPSGSLLVAYTDMGGPGGEGGIEIYHFHGAGPLTLYRTLLSGTPISQVVWDRSHHMYAISKKNNKLYVFTVTPTSVTENSSRSIGSPFRMVVLSMAGSTTHASAKESASVKLAATAH